VGTEIDRFVVLDPIGSGGMGVVVSAHDTMLDRKVALKLLRADRYPAARATEGKARLLREARAMAKLADHPHIITVHEVGLHADDIFIAMELVDGGTLRAWLEAKPRDWREFVQAYLAAGEGLAAAHRIGLVHRDFKPDNVLRGKDGRIRVTDFGLVIGETLESSPELLALPPDERTPTMSTETGVLLGTPSYMAPEQHKHANVDARADQYAFCVSLYEALYGQRPFSGANVEELAKRVLSGEPPTPPDRDVPGWLRELVLRGLSLDPDDRFTDMDELLSELRRDRRKIWRRVALVVGAAALVGGGAWLLWPAAPECTGGPTRLAGTWDDAARTRLRAAFDATKLPYAPEALERVSAEVDRYTQRWLALHRETCEATHVRGEQSVALLDRQMACLDRRLRSLGGLLALLAGQELQLSHAVEAVGELPGLDSCRAAEGLEVAPLPDDPTVRARLEAARVLVEEVDALQRIGRYPRSLERARAVDAEVRATEFPSLIAELLHTRALVENELGDYQSAENHLREAVQLAAAAHDDRRAAELWIALLYLVGDQRGRADDAMALRPVAEAALARIGNDPILTAHYLVNVAAVYVAQGDAHDAEPLLARAVALAEGANDPPADLAVTLRAHGSVLHRLGRYAQARRVLEKSLAATEEGLGPNHPMVADSLEHLGGPMRALGDAKAALPLLERARDIRLAAFGEDSWQVASSERALGDANAAAGNRAEAETHLRRSLAIAERLGDPDVLIPALNNLANLFLRAEEPNEALPFLERALAEQKKHLAEDHPQIGILMLGRAEALFHGGRLREAETAYREAEAQLARRLPPEHPYHAAPLAGLGQCLLAQSRPADALAPLERALTVTLAAPHEAIDVRLVKFMLARALWDTRGDRFRAKKLAQEAYDAYPPDDAGPFRGELRTWLDERK
jgi:tetratricopeptide (TPR) repeat protein/tRNA A-37 threonylcarbamoyl transferase component Bud32